MRKSHIARLAILAGTVAFALVLIIADPIGVRVADEAELRARVTNWGTDRNQRCRGVDWQFRTPNARIKLRRLYPMIQLN